MQIWIPSMLLLTTVLAAPNPLTARDSSEALGNIQYLTSSWLSYTVSLHNISRTNHIPIHPHHHTPRFNTSTLPLATQYAIIAIESAYNQNFKYESYPIDRIAAGPGLSQADSHAVVDATKRMVKAVRPLFEAFAVFTDVLGKDNLGYMLGYQDLVVEKLISAVEGVVVQSEKKAVEKQRLKHAKIVKDLKADLLA